MFFFQMQRCSLIEPFRYLQHVHKARRMFSRVIWKKCFSSKMRFSQNIPNLFWFCFLTLFFGWTFSNALWLGFSFASVKKSWPHNAPIRLYVRKNEKSWDLAKIKLEYSDKARVLSWNFFQRLPKLFLWPLQTFSRYVYGYFSNGQTHYLYNFLALTKIFAFLLW